MSLATGNGLSIDFRMTAAAAPTPVSTLPLVPLPRLAVTRPGRFALTADFTLTTVDEPDARVARALARALQGWQRRTGFTFPALKIQSGAMLDAEMHPTGGLQIAWENPAVELPRLGDPESYTLDVGQDGAVLKASSWRGVLHGLETFSQLLNYDGESWGVSAVSIQDEPRFPWRGLMIDVVRHWQSMDVIKRNLDGMALVKLNVLHLHLTDDQGFRIESKTHPRLHELGSDGHYFSHEEIRELIAYAADRGIRVVPEFDIPGHATSWLVAYPELGSAPGPYAVERRWGIFDPVLDPTNERVYAVLTDFLGEMAKLFPDPCLHIGGDENNGVHWTANAQIQTFIQVHGLKDNAGLHAYFNGRVHAILLRHGKRLVGWDEILHPDLPAGSLVHSWRGVQGVADAVTRGFSTILSNGFYIDLSHPASKHYQNDPVPADTMLSAIEQKRVLGGEATMWSEWVSPETIDSRIWPRTAAIAERLWSPRDVKDTADLYRRLALVVERLEEMGLQLERHRAVLVRRFAGEAAGARDVAALRTFIDVIEPVKEYQRGQYHAGHTQFTPLTGLADCARPESDAAREFADHVLRFLAGPPGLSFSSRETLQQQLMIWQNAGLVAANFLLARSAGFDAGAAVARGLETISGIGLSALDALTRGSARDVVWRDEQLARIDLAAQPHDAVQLPPVDAIRQLVHAAARETSLRNDRARE